MKPLDRAIFQIENIKPSWLRLKNATTGSLQAGEIPPTDVLDNT